MSTLRRLARSLELRLAPMPRFVVAGTGQCGTTYVAHVLQEAGVRCGHEEIFNASGITRSFRLTGDVSYLAVPYLPSYRGKVVHLVRNPVHVVRSLVGIELLDHPDWLWVKPILPYIDRSGDLQIDAMRFYLRWNSMIEPYAAMRVRIEDFDRELPAVLALVAPRRARSAAVPASTVPTNTNTKKRAEGIDTIDDLPDSVERDQLAAMGERYGYDMKVGSEARS